MTKHDPDHSTLRDEGEYLGVSEEPGCDDRLYQYQGIEYIVLCDNTIITREEDNAKVDVIPSWPYSLSEKQASAR